MLSVLFHIPHLQSPGVRQKLLKIIIEADYDNCYHGGIMDEKYNLLPGMADSHFHSLEMEKKGLDAGVILEKCFSMGMSYALDISTNTETFGKRLDFARLFKGVYITAGLSPGKAERNDSELKSMLEQLEMQLYKNSSRADSSREGRLAGVGETGLDWYWNYGTRDRQVHLFRNQLALAEKYSLPVIVHNREADKEILESLKEEKLSRGGIIHCFSSDYSFASKCLDLGFYISFAGNLTYKKSTALHEAAKKLPAGSILVETDAPYLAPGKMRGRLNHPGFIGYTYSFLAEIKDMDVQDLVYSIKTNFINLFNLKKEECI